MAGQQHGMIDRCCSETQHSGEGEDKKGGDDVGKVSLDYSDVIQINQTHQSHPSYWIPDLSV